MCFAYHSNLVSSIIYFGTFYPENMTFCILDSRRSYLHKKWMKDHKFKKKMLANSGQIDLSKCLLDCISLSLNEECSVILYMWRLSLDVNYSHSCSFIYVELCRIICNFQNSHMSSLSPFITPISTPVISSSQYFKSGTILFAPSLQWEFHLHLSYLTSFFLSLFPKYIITCCISCESCFLSFVLLKNEFIITLQACFLVWQRVLSLLSVVRN